MRSSPEDDDDQPLTTPVVPLAVMVLTLVLALGRMGPISPSQVQGMGLLAPLVGYALAELLAPRLAGFGRFPLSASALLITVGCAGMGRAPWLMLLGIGLLIRFARARMRSESLLSLLSDGLPELWAGLAAWSAPESARPFAGALVYFLAWQFLPGLFAQAVPARQLAVWTLARERSATAVIFLSVLGGVLSGLTPQNPASVAFLLAALPLATSAATA